MDAPAFKALVRFVAMSVVFLHSTHGALQWTLHPIPREGTNEVVWLTSAAYGNGKFVAIDGDGQNYSATAAEPQHWTRGPSIPDVNLSTIIFAAGKFTAVGLDTKTTNSLFLTSTDGIDWTRQRLQSDARLSDVAYGNGRFVVIGPTPLSWSTNGVDWVMETNSLPNPLIYIASLDFVDGEFMATFADEQANPVARTKLAISTDGRNWQVPEGSWYFSGIAYGRKVYVGLGVTDCVPCGFQYSSMDGRTWESRGLPNNVNGLAITYANGVFAISGWGRPSALLSSTDGLRWDEFRIGDYDLLPGLTFGAGRFVATGIGLVAVSDYVGSLPIISNYRVSAESIEFDFAAEWKTEWQVETSEDLSEWTVVKEFEGAEFGPEKVSVPRDGNAMRFVRLKEKK